jgi:hypothetical protein
VSQFMGQGLSTNLVQSVMVKALGGDAISALGQVKTIPGISNLRKTLRDKH